MKTQKTKPAPPTTPASGAPPTKRRRTVAYVTQEQYDAERGFRVVFVTEGDDGYRPTGTWPYTGAVGETMPWFWGKDEAAALARCAEYNARLGISPEEAQQIIDDSIMASMPKPAVREKRAKR